MGELYRLAFPNGKFYIGIAANGACGRFLDHSRAATNMNFLLYRAWRKYVEPKLTVLAIVENALLYEVEIKAIAAFKTFGHGGYNMTRGGDGSLGCKLSPETRAMISVAVRNQSQETRAKKSAAHKGVPLSPEHVLRIVAARRGYTHSLETRAKIGAANRRRVVSPKTRAKIGIASRNRSPEAIEKMSIAKKGITRGPRSEQHRKNLSIAIKENWAMFRRLKQIAKGRS